MFASIAYVISRQDARYTNLMYQKFLLEGQGFIPLLIPRDLFSVETPFTAIVAITPPRGSPTEPTVLTGCNGARGEVGILFKSTCFVGLVRGLQKSSSSSFSGRVGLEKETEGNASMSYPRLGEDDC